MFACKSDLFWVVRGFYFLQVKKGLALPFFDVYWQLSSHFFFCLFTLAPVNTVRNPILSAKDEVCMVTIEKIDTRSKAQVNEFVRFHYDLYRGHPQWVPPFYADIHLMLNRDKHPWYEHSDADFFVARRGKEMVGRIAVMENKPFNKYHDVRKAQFYLFDTIDDQDVANCLFDAAADWSRKRNLDTLVGPKGFSSFDGYGIQIEGFEHRQMMIMMNYNFPYYQRLVEGLGCEKEVDFVSCYLAPQHFRIPEKMREVARRVAERGKFKVVNFKSRGELKQYANRIGEAYNKTFVNNWEYYPLSQREIKFVIDQLITNAVPKLYKVIMYNDDVAGFLLGFPDISEALMRQKGHITPWGVVDYMLELKRTQWVSLNGVGVLPEYHGRGGNALMYYEMEKTLIESNYKHAELTQVAETAVQMRKDLITGGGKAYKNHRVFRLHL
jgi:hypothetical protein